MTLIHKLRSQVGLALDETILVMTMLSGFAGFVVVANPLDLLGDTVNPTQLVSELQEIEEANYEFYRRYLNWPHETTSGEWKDNITVLQTPNVMKAYHRNRVYSAVNFLPNYERSRQTGGLLHNWGDGGGIFQHVVEHDGEKYLEIILENIPYDMAYDVDSKIDGKYDPNNGRVQVLFEGDKVSLHYRANKV